MGKGPKHFLKEDVYMWNLKDKATTTTKKKTDSDREISRWLSEGRRVGEWEYGEMVKRYKPLVI